MKEMHHNQRNPSTGPSGDCDRSHDLDWLAFRYIANEMSDGERDAFESRLVNEQDAREAVAAAVDLSQTVLLVEELPRPTVHAPRPWRLAAAWMSLGACVCLAVIIGGQYVAANFSRHRTQPSASEGPAELASLWSQTRLASLPEGADTAYLDDVDAPRSVDGESQQEVLADGTSDASVETDWMPGNDDVEQDAGGASPRGTPSWMIIGVRATARQAGENSADGDARDGVSAPADKIKEL